MDLQKELIASVSKLLADVVIQWQPFGRGAQKALWVEVGAILEVAKRLKADQDLGFDWLENLSVFDMDGTLVTTYFIRSTQTGNALIMRASVVPAGVDKEVEVVSVSGVWTMAARMEKEVSELFGISFLGNLRKCNEILPSDFKGYPLRKISNYELK